MLAHKQSLTIVHVTKEDLARKERTLDTDHAPVFVFMNKPGHVPGRAIQQIRSHAARTAIKRKRSPLNKPLGPAVNIRFGSSFDPLQALPQLEIEKCLPLVDLKHHLFTFFGQRRMNTEIWPHGIHDVAFYTSMLLKASRHRDCVHGIYLSPTTSALKSATMAAVHARLSNPETAYTIETIIPISWLASPSLAQNNATHEYLNHRKAYNAIIEHVGGLEALAKTSEFAHGVLQNLVVHVFAKTCDIPNTSLVTIEDVSLTGYESIFKTDSQHPDVRLASPFYCVDPAQTPFMFGTIEDEQTRKLLLMLQHCFLHSVDLRHQQESTALEIQQNLSSIINTVEPPHESSSTIYDICYWTTMITLWTFEKRCDWRRAVTGTEIVPRLTALVRSTDFGDLWGSNIGVLYWVLLILYCASDQAPTYFFMEETVSRMWFHMIFKMDDWRGMLSPLLVMRDLSRTANRTGNVQRTSARKEV